jgi:YD repeat-containing protein
MRNSTIGSIVLALGLLAFGTGALASTTSYQFDALGRISVVTEGSATVRYIYDPAGNRTQKQTQGGIATTLTMPSSTSIEHEGSIVLSVNVGGTSATGKVSFYEGSTFLGEAIVMNGVATVELIGLTRGAHNITTTYSGDVTNASNSVSFPLNVINIDWLPGVLEILMN